MRISIIIGATAASLALAGCGGKGDDKLADQAEQAMDNKADTLDAMADNSSGATEDSLEAQADATREAGDAKEEAIDDSDVNADALSNGQKEAIINGQ